MANPLRETIEAVLEDVHIETGTRAEWERVVSELERAIAEKVTRGEIDYYTEVDKVPPSTVSAKPPPQRGSV